MENKREMLTEEEILMIRKETEEDSTGTFTIRGEKYKIVPDTIHSARYCAISPICDGFCSIRVNGEDSFKYHFEKVNKKCKNS